MAAEGEAGQLTWASARACDHTCGEQEAQSLCPVCQPLWHSQGPPVHGPADHGTASLQQLHLQPILDAAGHEHMQGGGGREQEGQGRVRCVRNDVWMSY